MKYSTKLVIFRPSTENQLARKMTVAKPKLFIHCKSKHFALCKLSELQPYFPSFGQ